MTATRKLALSDMPDERIKVPAASKILGVKPRTVQYLAANKKIPGAAKVGERWTFNERILRKWLMDKEIEQCPTYINEKALITDVFASVGVNVVEAYRQLLKPLPSNASTNGSRT